MLLGGCSGHMVLRNNTRIFSISKGILPFGFKLGGLGLGSWRIHSDVFRGTFWSCGIAQ